MRTIVFILIFFASYSFGQSEKKIAKAWKVFQVNNAKGIQKLEKYISKEDEVNLLARAAHMEMYLSFFQTKFSSVYNSKSGIKNRQEACREEHVLRAIKADTSLSKDSLRLLTDSLTLRINHYKTKSIGNLGPLYNDVYGLAYDYSMRFKMPQADYALMNMMYTSNPDTIIFNCDDKDLFELVDAGKVDSETRERIFELYLLYPDSYSVNSSIADIYFAEGNQDSARKYVQNNINNFPYQLSPRLQMAQIHNDKEDYYNAKKQLINALIIYPGGNIAEGLNGILNMERKEFTFNHIVRPGAPLHTNAGFEKRGEGIWKEYYKSDDKIRIWQSSQGIIRKIDTTKYTKDQIDSTLNRYAVYDIEELWKLNTIYAEVNAWNYVLDEYRDKRPVNLFFAYDMEREGYLDCFALFSNYNIDLKDQYDRFIREEGNFDKVRTYIETFLINPISNQD